MIKTSQLTIQREGEPSLVFVVIRNDIHRRYVVLNFSKLSVARTLVGITNIYGTKNTIRESCAYHMEIDLLKFVDTDTFANFSLKNNEERYDVSINLDVMKLTENCMFFFHFVF